MTFNYAGSVIAMKSRSSQGVTIDPTIKNSHVSTFTNFNYFFAMIVYCGIKVLSFWRLEGVITSVLNVITPIT